MIKPIVKDVFFLRQKSNPATSQDLQTGQDLYDYVIAIALGYSTDMKEPHDLREQKISRIG